jgi:hypothetical protein
MNHNNSSSNQVVIEALQEKSKCIRPITLTWRNIVVYPPEKRTSIINKIRKKNDDYLPNPNKLIIDNGNLLFNEKNKTDKIIQFYLFF